jgi:hypothetical protein
MGATGHDEVSHATWRRAIAGTLAGVALLATGGCSPGDDGSNDGDGDEVEGVELETGTTQAPASDLEAVTGHVEDLLSDYEDAVNAILLDQEVTLDGSSPEVEAYRALFEPGSEAVAETLGGWQANAEAGVEYRPADPSQPGVRSWLDGDLDAVSDDEVTFPTCDEHHMETLDGEGRLIEEIEVVGLAGEGVAVRVGGRWYLRDLELLPDEPPCDVSGRDNTGAGSGDTGETDDDETEGR